MYMLAGGTDASNTDPYASKPTAGNTDQTGPPRHGGWRRSQPSTTLTRRAPIGYFGAVRDVGGTPYQHLMAPVRRAAHAAPAMKEEAPKDAAAK